MDKDKLYQMVSSHNKHIVWDIKNYQHTKFQGYFMLFFSKTLLTLMCDQMKNGFKNSKKLMWAVISKR